MTNKLPKHLQKIIDTNMESNKGRILLANLVGADYYRNVNNKIKRRGGY